MQRNKPKSGEIYRHFKNNLYQIITLAQKEEDQTELVIYQALYGDFGIYARTLENFMEPVDTQKYKNVSQQYRFELIDKNDLKKQDVVQSNEKITGTLENIETTNIDTMNKEVTNTERINIETTNKETTNTETINIEAQGTPETVPLQSNLVKEDLDSTTEAESQEVADPTLLAFCDTKTFLEKYEMVKGLRYEITDRLVNDLAVVLDVVIPEGNIEYRYEALLKCLQTFCKYEVNRLR